MKIFSIPLNPKLTEVQFEYFIDFCLKYKDYIYDIYFTCKIPPFLQDAMGDIFINEEDNNFVIKTALYVQEKTGIKVSATFNNIEVRPSQQNLDLWIKNFKPLYDAGITSCTIPHTHWILTKQIQNEFPNLFIKNTILREVSEAREVANLAKAGFNYINLDRNLMRNKERLLEIKKVKEKYNIKLSLLANEGCLGGCPVMSEHFEFNNTRVSDPQYFNDPISRVSCPKWDVSEPAIQLKTANLPPWKEDWLEFLELGIDVFKMHGRESTNRLLETIDIIKNFADNKEILFNTFNDYIEETNLGEKPISIWRNKIKNCKFDCWDCNYCDKIWEAKGNKVNTKVKKVSEIVIDSVLKQVNVNIEGLTSNRVKQLLNSLGSISTHYLEVGCLNGSTFCSSIKDNTLVCYAVDNWGEQTQSLTTNTDIKSSKQIFIDNVKEVKGNNTIKIFDCDYKNIDKSKINKIDFFFYDACHSLKETKEAVKFFSEKFEDNCILVFDDANWTDVVLGANLGIKESGFSIAYSKLILNTIENPDDWWNGLYIVVLTTTN